MTAAVNNSLSPQCIKTESSSKSIVTLWLQLETAGMCFIFLSNLIPWQFHGDLTHIWGGATSQFMRKESFWSAFGENDSVGKKQSIHR